MYVAPRKTIETGYHQNSCFLPQEENKEEYLYLVFLGLEILCKLSYDNIPMLVRRTFWIWLCLSCVPWLPGLAYPFVRV